MPRLLIILVCVCAAASLIASCSSSIRNRPSLPPPRVLGLPPEDAIGPSILDGGPASHPAAGVENTAPTATFITLDQAIRLVLAKSPDLAATAEAVRAKEGDARQAALWPNPDLIGEAENFGGTGNKKSFETAEYTVSLAQPLDVSGKIKRRATAADYERLLAGWDYETKRLDLITSTRKVYAELVAAQRKVELTKELARLADELANAVGARVQAGKVSPVEATRIEVVKAATRTEAFRAAQELSTARAALAALWGDTSATFGRAAQENGASVDLPPPGALEPWLADAPEAARWSDEIALRQAELELTRATIFPDLTASIGARHFAENDDNALVAGLSVPLPVIDRKQGAIAAAVSRRTEAERRRAAVLARQNAEFQGAYDALKRAQFSVRSLEERIIPSAESVFAATTTGYRSGKFGLIDLLDAQRTLFEVQAQGVEARADFAKARADLERLIARSIEVPQQSKP